MPTARNGTTAVYNGKIYVMGGQVSYQSTDVVEIYDPETDTWTTGLASMPTPQHWLGSSGSPVSNGIIYVLGPGNTSYGYDPQSDAGGTLNPMPDNAVGIAAINGSIYAIGSEHTFHGVTSTTKDLVAYWSFDNGDATDDSGNGNNGTVHGATLTDDRFGNANSAFSFGANNYVQVVDNNDLDITSSITMAAWIYRAAHTADWESIFCKGHTSSITSPYALLIRQNTISLLFNRNEMRGSLDIPANEWVHVAVTWDGANVKYWDQFLLGHSIHSRTIRSKS